MTAESEEQKASKAEQKPVDVDDVVIDSEQALRIISISEDGTEFTLDEQNLTTVMAEVKKLEEEAPKVAVVSVVGAFRTGKSFLLSSLLRYLKLSDSGNVPGDRWMTEAGDVLTQGNVEIEKAESGFQWRSGKDRMTTGIWMYSKPFVRKLPDSNEKVCLLLMDTQGMFDFRTTKELTAAIFGLSTLISSYQIYNIAKQIQEDKLQQLHYFTEFSRVALTEFEKAKHRVRQIKKKSLQRAHSAPLPESEDDMPENRPSYFRHNSLIQDKAGHISGQAAPSFQTLDFVVRDWQNFEDDEDISQCLSEMPGVLKAAMETEMDDGGTRENINKAFAKIGCFLLPHPGTKMTKKQFTGNLADVEDNFLQLLEIYVKRVCDEGLVAKQIHGKSITASQLELYIRAYAEQFKSGTMPKAYTLVQAISATTNLCAKDDCFRGYKQLLNQKLGSQSYMAPEALDNWHKECSEASLTKFDVTACFGDDTQIQDTKKQLKELIEEYYQDACEKNKLMMHANLQKYIIPILLAIAAFMMDWASDYLCDSWSDTCQKLSKNFALLYYCVAAILVYEFYKIYRSTGSATNVWLGATALINATLLRFQELQAWAGKEWKKLSSTEKPKEE
mmetsp:Transcript_24422/g.34472  ORF Transcript_24422/g.34472 Transcript_24422/m.34472 type:complete len:616 (+) Transcript_24422:40-1887(+)|eukprot:CAMPEP_0175090122 /NCGR_PEP_ID=MMETSP0086_2-20121207/1158_1 /TAXON_ID=136419 /ORGANISM="Unknown Unknown, Strain D1" /LENGTH=615 /DNA_ID=CAMNT_0016362691 /DNA_START=30 /DNA_END=1877 /DNA_ORIENTATION=-